MRNSDTGLGDVARAIAAIQPSPAELRRIASLLGFESAAERSVEVPGPIASNPIAPQSHRHRRAPQVDDIPAAALKRSGLRSELVKLPPETVPAPWLGLEPLEPPGVVTVPKLEPLLHPLWQRAILGDLVASLWPIGSIDIVAIARRMTSGRPIRMLPRFVRRTISRGAHLLVDRSASMLPFMRDCHQLAEYLQRIVGGTLNLRHFRGVPTKDVFGSAPHEPPSEGGTVVIASDFGSGPRVPGEERSGLHEWLRFLETMRSARVLVVALVPGDSRGLPPALRQRMAVVAWERTTTSGRVRAERCRAEAQRGHAR